MPEYQKWKQLIGNKKRRQILYLLRNMGVATQAQIQDEFRKRNVFPSWMAIHNHVKILEGNKMLVRTMHPPLMPERKQQGKIVKAKTSLYITYELTAEASMWLNALESKGKGMLEGS